MITATDLLQELLKDGVVSEPELVRLLGVERHDIPLPELEVRLIGNGVLSERKLLAFKGQVAGLPLADDPEVKPVPQLPEAVSRAAGAIALSSPAGAVAFVEPNERNLETVAQSITVRVQPWLMTAGQFKYWFQRLYQNSKETRLPEAPSLVALFDEAIRGRATDIHLQAATPPRLRVDGELVSLPFAPLDRPWLAKEIRHLFGSDAVDSVQRDTSWDCAWEHGTARFRINLGIDSKGPTLSGRVLASSIPSMDDLGLPTAVREFTNLERGLVLVTGPTGSGKSTTLAALLDHIAKNQRRHLITLEDPIEYVLHPGKDAMVNQRELGRDFRSFPAALRQALRQDPDVLLVGEIRDPETASTAITAAETGHLVFGTLHTFDAQSTVTRLVSMHPDGEQDHVREKLAYLIKGVVSQTLLPRSGRPGRVAAMEIMLSTPAIINNLRNAGGISALRSTMQTSRKEGMQTMEMALAALVMRGMVSQEEAESRVRAHEEFHRYLNTITIS